MPALARSTREVGLRMGAVEALARLGAREEIEGLLPLLREAPPLTWALHIALLDAARVLGLRPEGLERVSAADNLHVQVALARLGAA